MQDACQTARGWLLGFGTAVCTPAGQWQCACALHHASLQADCQNRRARTAAKSRRGRYGGPGCGARIERRATGPFSSYLPAPLGLFPDRHLWASSALPNLRRRPRHPALLGEWVDYMEPNRLREVGTLRRRVIKPRLCGLHGNPTA